MFCDAAGSRDHQSSIVKQSCLSITHTLPSAAISHDAECHRIFENEGNAPTAPAIQILLMEQNPQNFAGSGFAFLLNCGIRILPIPWNACRADSNGNLAIVPFFAGELNGRSIRQWQ